MKEQIKLSDHFTYGKLFRFALPSVIMLVFSSIYGVVDGIFVSNFAGKTEFSAVNFIMPIFMIIGGIGFMMGAGGTAIVARTLGEGNPTLAKRYFSLFVYFTAIVGSIAAALGVIFIRPLSAFLGAEGQLLDCCERYGSIVIAAMPAFMIQNLFQSFFIVAEKPKIGLLVTVAAGVTNMVLDAVLVLLLPQELKLEGAAIATATSQAVGGIVPIIYFGRKNTSLLKLGKTAIYGRALLKAMTNGSSELLSNISSSVVTMLYNTQLLRLEGEDGVAAYGIIMYVGFIFVAMFIGYAIGTAPLVGYHFGANNKKELKNLFLKSSVICFTAGATMTLVAFLFARPLSIIFASYDQHLLEMTVQGFQIFSFTFVCSGFAIYGSSFFTALNDGITSAILAFLRTVVFQISLILTLPLIWQLNGVWFSSLFAEILALISTVTFLLIYRKKYGYL